VITRVIQWATGAVGLAELRAVIDDPNLDLVGLFVYSSDKVGLDAGTIAGRPPTGVAATNDKQHITALDADIVLHAASKSFPVNTNTDDIVTLLASGKNVITTTSYNHLPTFGRDVSQRIQAACATGAARFHAAGEHPGFMFERLASTVTGLCQRVDLITLQEFADCSNVAEPGMLIDLMGMGKQPEDISVDSPMFRAISVQYEQALAATAETLELRIDEIRSQIRTGVVDTDVNVACGVLPAGSVVGQLLSWGAYRDQQLVLAAEEYWMCTSEIPGWDPAPDEEFLVRIKVEGAPSLTVDLRIDPGPIPGFDGTSGGHLAVAMTAVRAIPDVLKSAPGIVTPEIFGAYRWPGDGGLRFRSQTPSDGLLSHH
jgi:2,4-diaminopentanoate dehydrogenase